MRTFLSIDIPEKLHSKIRSLQRNLPGFQGKLTELKEMHLTLKFFGDVSLEILEKIKLCLRGLKFKKFHAKLSEVGVFTPNSVRIIWVKIEGVEELQKQVDYCLQNLFSVEARFMSHLTIARVKTIDKRTRKEFLDKISKLKMNEEFEVDKIILKKSELFREGPEYRDLEEFRLE